MALGVKIGGVRELNADFARISKELINAPLLNAVALDAKAVVLKRTGKGKDFTGSAFKPYSKGYKKQRQKKGRQTSKVDLQMKRHMLADMHTTVNVNKGESRVTFRRTEEKKKAIYHHITGAGKSRVKREFFGLGKKDRAGLEKRIDKHIRKVIR